MRSCSLVRVSRPRVWDELRCLAVDAGGLPGPYKTKTPTASTRLALQTDASTATPGRDVAGRSGADSALAGAAALALVASIASAPNPAKRRRQRRLRKTGARSSRMTSLCGI